MSIGKKLTTQEVQDRLKKFNFTLYGEYINCNTKTKIKCHCGNIFECKLGDVFQNRIKSCGKCKNRLLINKYPEIAKEWHPTKNNNLTPKDVTYASAKRVWWLCPNGHEYQSTIANRTYMRKCPYCSGNKVLIGFNDLLTTHPELCKEWDYTKNTILPTQISYGHTKKVWWICSKCGHSYKAVVHSRTYSKSSCPKCWWGRSKGEEEIERILILHNIKYITQYRFKDCKYKKTLPFDFYLPNHNLIIEFNGKQHYDINKTFPTINYDTQKQQFKLIQLRDKIKYDYCMTHNIKLLIIKYTDYKNIEQLILHII